MPNAHMPTTRTLAKLFQALAAKDLSTAEQVATEIAAAEKGRGHHSAAQLLKAALRSNGIRGHRMPEPITGVIGQPRTVAGHRLSSTDTLASCIAASSNVLLESNQGQQEVFSGKQILRKPG